MMSNAIEVSRYCERAVWLLLAMLMLQGCTAAKMRGDYEVVHEGDLSSEYQYRVMICRRDDGDNIVRFEFLKGEDLLVQTECEDDDLVTGIFPDAASGVQHSVSVTYSEDVFRTMHRRSDKLKTDVMLDFDGSGFPETWVTITGKERITREVVPSVVKIMRRPVNQ